MQPHPSESHSSERDWGIDPTNPGARRSATTTVRRARPAPRAGAVRLALLVTLVLGVVWAAATESDVPLLKFAERPSVSGTNSLGTLRPGTHSIDAMEITKTGEWVTQRFGSNVALVSSNPSDFLAFRFYGTEVQVVARIGPEAGRAYVLIDGQPPAGLTEDERGAYLRLRAPQAIDTPLTLATGLAHREHLVQIAPGSQGELAISSVVVRSETPFLWAFVGLYATLATTIFVVARQIAIGVTLRPERLPSRAERPFGSDVPDGS